MRGYLDFVILHYEINDDDNVNDNYRPEGKRSEAQSTLVQTSEMQASLRFLSESSQVSMTKSLTSTLTLDFNNVEM